MQGHFVVIFPQISVRCKSLSETNFFCRATPLASRELLPPPPTYPPLPQEQSQLPPPASVPAVQPTGTPPLGPVSEIQTGLTSAAMCDQSEWGSALSCCPFGFNRIASVPK